MSTLQDKYEAIDDRFKEPSKARDAARYIVRMNHKITSDERKAIIAEIPIKRKTLEGVFTELRKLNLYPPQKTVEAPKRAPALEKPEEPAQHIKENPPPTLQEYATREDLETLRNSTTENLELLTESVNNLSSLLNVDTPPNPGETEEEGEIDVHNPEEIVIQDASLTRANIFLKPKTQMLFDMARQGVFVNYAGTREPGPFADFEGNLSDFVNIMADDYFGRLYYAEIGLTMRRYTR